MPDALPAAADIDLARWVRPGDTVMWGQAEAEPLSLVRALVEQRHRFARTRAFLGISHSGLVQPEHADAIDLVAYCGSGTNRQLVEAGVLDIWPGRYSTLPERIRCGDLRVDVLLLQVPPADASGAHSLGLAQEYLVAALDTARVVIVEANDRVPWVFGERELAPGVVDASVSASYAPLSAPSRPAGAVERAIAAHAAGFVEDGATLQCGLGMLPDAVLSALTDRRELGVHSGTIGDGVAALIQAGIVTNSRKGRDAGVTVAGILMGSDRLRRYAHRNPAIALRGTDYTHHPDVLASLPKLVAINSAIEVDLTGQVNAEVAAGRYVGAVGGAPDFVAGAQRSRGGVPMVVLPSTAGSHSRVVARLSGPVSTARCDAGVFVTEHGVADLRGLPLGARIRRMLDIAAPEHRERLEREAFDETPPSTRTQP